MSRIKKKSDLRSKKHKKVWMALNCIEQLLTITYFCYYWKVSISTFASLVGIPIGIASSPVKLKFVQ